MCGASFPTGLRFSYAPSLGGWRLRLAHRHKAWLWTALRGEQAYLSRPLPEPLIHQVVYHFISRSEMISLHARALGIESPTDILTYDYREGGDQPLLAELFVCPAYVEEVAPAFGQRYGEEMRRVLAHGILHLLGYTDHLPHGRLRMRVAEERWLSLWKAPLSVSHETA